LPFRLLKIKKSSLLDLADVGLLLPRDFQSLCFVFLRAEKMMTLKAA